MALQGELTMHTAPTLLKGADTLIAEGSVDLAGITAADSAGVAFLLELTRQAKVAGKKLTFANCPSQLRGLVDFFELNDVVALAETP